MISKNIREVKKTQKKNIQPHKRERERERERTKSLHDLALELCPENFTIKYEQMKNGVECRGVWLCEFNSRAEI